MAQQGTTDGFLAMAGFTPIHEPRKTDAKATWAGTDACLDGDQQAIRHAALRWCHGRRRSHRKAFMYQRILVPTDGSTTSEKGLTEAIAIAKLSGGRIRLVHVLDALSVAIGGDGFGSYSTEFLPSLRDAGQEILTKARQRVEATGVEVDDALREMLSGRVSDQVLQEAAAWEAELIVIGTHGRRGVRRMLLGSDAEQVLRQASVPILLVRGE
ncbi:universal stress protein [Pelomonas sp. Root1217]|uniref:universal stress protein n=1 Tax=Pelomonas sp. Root1217 TaxID=1736430 RepID=UPI001F4298FF|nr:universal stress protein [Pelomonas sp. Root1217]